MEIGEHSVDEASPTASIVFAASAASAPEHPPLPTGATQQGRASAPVQQPPQRPTGRPTMPPSSRAPANSSRVIEEHLRKRRRRAFLAHTFLFLLDALMINVAFLTAYYIRFVLLHGVQFTTIYIDAPLSSFARLEAVVTAGVLLLFVVRGLYGLRVTGTWFKQFWLVSSAVTAGFAIFAAYDYVLRETDVTLGGSRFLVGLSWLLIIMLVSLARLLVASVVSLLYRHGRLLTGVLVVGSGRIGKLMMQQIAANPNLGYRVEGFIHDMDGPLTDFGRFRALGTMDDLARVIGEYNISEVIIALPSHQRQHILRTAQICEEAGADFK
ncbi:MAG TPA: hypothetical protein VKQ36_08275, partial [Ktedonobacterales bacterium]|nr:hypothetical protein [Ktedonobacterales bacterium]